MLFKTTLLLVAPLCITAFQPMVLVPQVFDKRSIPSTGGWSLQANTCPLGTDQCGAAWCCPNSLTCVQSGDSDNAEACCPSCEEFHRQMLCCTRGTILTITIATPCQPSLQAAPVCADSSWNLWNTTNVDSHGDPAYTGYLCCLPGQIGIQGVVDTVGDSAICVTPGTPFPQTASGTLVSCSQPAQNLVIMCVTGRRLTWNFCYR